MHRRTSIYLDDNAMKALKLLAAASGTTVSEKIREAVDTMLATQVGQVDWSAEIKTVRTARHETAEKKRHART